MHFSRTFFENDKNYYPVLYAEILWKEFERLDISSSCTLSQSQPTICFFDGCLREDMLPECSSDIVSLLFYIFLFFILLFFIIFNFFFPFINYFLGMVL
jgi:hypothetical protein